MTQHGWVKPDSPTPGDGTSGQRHPQTLGQAMEGTRKVMTIGSYSP